MKIILTGATGFAGSEVLKQLLAGSSVEQVTILTRRPAGVIHNRLKEIVLPDFLDYSKITEDLKADACIWCLGVSQTEVSKEKYIQITYDYAIYGAKVMLAVNPDMRFCFLSGSSADQDEKGLSLQGKIKGRTEKALSKLDGSVFSFRPAFIRPSDPGQQRPFAIKVGGIIAWIIDLFTGNFTVEVATLARCLISVAKSGTDREILDNRFICNYIS